MDATKVAGRLVALDATARFTGEARRDAPLPPALASVKASPLARFALDVATRKKD